MKRVLLVLLVLGLVSLVGTSAFAYGPHGGYGHHSGHGWHHPAVIVAPRPVVVARPVIVSPYPAYYPYAYPPVQDCGPHGSLGYWGRNFGISIGF